MSTLQWSISSGQASTKSSSCHFCSRACQQAAIPSICLPDSIFSKSFVICSSFRIIIDQGPDTSCDWAIRYRKNFSLSLCQSTSTPAHLSWWYSRRGPNMYLCYIQSWIYYSSVPHSLVYWPCHSSRRSWQIQTKWSAWGSFRCTPGSLGSRTKLELQ